jgi:hypothetical protein
VKEVSVKKVLTALVLTAAVGCSGGEKKDGEAKPRAPKRPVAESDVPKPILASWAKSFPGAKATGWTERGGDYMAKGIAANHWVDVKFTADGAVKESEVEIASDAAPAPVKAAFTSSPYAKLTFVDCYDREAPGNKDYPSLIKFIVKDGEKPVIAVYGLDGKFVKEKTMPNDKFDKWRSEHTVTKP